MLPSAFNPSSPIILPGVTYANLGQKIIPVHHSGPGNLDQAPSWFSEDGRTSIEDALALVRSGRGDVIQLLPGHTQNVASADAWSALGSKTGVRIVGPDFGPPATLTWTVAGSTVLFDQSGFSIDGGPFKNIILNLEPGAGTVVVAAPITVSAANCVIARCRIRMGTDAANYVTNGITTTAAGDDLRLLGNTMYSATAATPTSMIKLVGADRLQMIGNYIAGAVSAVTDGVVLFATTASLDIFSAFNTFINRKALGTAAVVGLAGVSGVSYEDHFSYLDNASKTPWLTSTGIMSFHRPTVANDAGETGTEVVGTVSA